MFPFILVALFPSIDTGFTITILYLIPWSIYRVCVTGLMDQEHNYSSCIKTLTDDTWTSYFFIPGFFFFLFVAFFLTMNCNIENILETSKCHQTRILLSASSQNVKTSPTFCLNFLLCEKAMKDIGMRHWSPSRKGEFPAGICILGEC